MQTNDNNSCCCCERWFYECDEKKKKYQKTFAGSEMTILYIIFSTK